MLFGLKICFLHAGILMQTIGRKKMTTRKDMICLCGAFKVITLVLF